MKCKSLLLLLSVMWAVCSSTLEARDLLVSWIPGTRHYERIPTGGSTPMAL